MLAVALEAEKVIFLTDVEGLYADVQKPDSLISQCSLADVDKLIEESSVSKGMIPSCGLSAGP